MTELGVALITGAGSGIGRAVAIALAGDGWRLTLAGRRAAALEATAARCDGMAHVVATDVADVSQVAALFQAVEGAHGRLDLLFNNAGIDAPVAPVDELDPADWRRVIDVNLTGAFLCARGAMALMKRQTPGGGRIINNGSVSAQTPRPHSAPYAASKHAITGLTKAIALDGRPHDIACGQIDIGNAASEMWDGNEADMLQPDGGRAAEPIIDVAHVVDAVRYMAGLPPDANVLTMTVMATRMPLVGRG